MEETSHVIMTKIKLVSSDFSSSATYSAYHQSEEIRELWKLIDSSIQTIVNKTSNQQFTNDKMDASSQIISILCASTLISSVIHALIITQRRLNKSDEQIENIINKEMQVVLYHIQILKQDFNRSHITSESVREAILYHTNLLVDSLIAYSLFPSNNLFQAVHPYKVSPSTSYQRRHSQPANLFRNQSSSSTASSSCKDHQQVNMKKVFSEQPQYDTNHHLNSNSSNSTLGRDTVGKKFMRSIHSLKSARKSYSNTSMTTLLPTNHHQSIIEPTISTELYPKKKQFFYSHHEEEEEMPNEEYQDFNTTPKPNNHSSTLRFMFTRRQSAGAALNGTAKRNSGIKDLFLSSSPPPIQPQHEPTTTKNKRESSLANLFSSNHKCVQIEDGMQGPIANIYSASSASTSTSSASSSTDNSELKKQQNRSSMLIFPFSKKTNIQWDEDNKAQQMNNQFNSYSMMVVDSSLSREEENYNPDFTVKREETPRKRCSNGSMVPTSTSMTRNNSPLLPLPTVENFLTTMNTPVSPESSYFSARSSSSSLSPLSILNSVLLDDVTDYLTKTEISKVGKEQQHNFIQTPSIPPPKDNQSIVEQHMDPQNHSLTNMNNKQEKRMSLRNSIISSDIRISTNNIIPPHVSITAPKSAGVTNTNKSVNRLPIPARTSSMPLPPSPADEEDQPPLPLDAKTKASNYNKHRHSAKLDEWLSSGIVNNKKRDKMIRSKLGRSLGSQEQVAKMEKNAKFLKVTENSQVVLVFEMIDGKLQVIAGTSEKLFERLADETAQDMDYLHTYLMNHNQFIKSLDLLNLLINRFYLEPSPGEYEYFKKWQISIQTKVLNVVKRWINSYYQDFAYDTALLKRLNSFLYHDDLILAPVIQQQLEKLRLDLKFKATQFDRPNHLFSNAAPIIHSSNLNFNFHFPFVNNQVFVHTNNRRPSNGLFHHQDSSSSTLTCSVYTLYTSFSSLESREIARYLTLADYNLFKLIQAHGLLNTSKKPQEDDDMVVTDYTDLMTTRANLLSHWVVHEICRHSYLKPKRTLLKKFIEIAKLCLEMNNFHTCMVITMGLASAPKLKETWESLSNRDMTTFTSLQKLLDVNLNMRFYRHKINQAKSPALPFLPVVLKDQTFFNENSTFSVTHPRLINFCKFRQIRQFVDKLHQMTQESYSFQTDLTRYPFFPTLDHEKHEEDGCLNSIGDWIENRLNEVKACYLHCDLLSNS